MGILAAVGGEKTKPIQSQFRPAEVAGTPDVVRTANREQPAQDNERA